jgi:hypothetical protein
MPYEILIGHWPFGADAQKVLPPYSTNTLIKYCYFVIKETIKEIKYELKTYDQPTPFETVHD